MHNTYAVLYTQGPLASTANVLADEGIVSYGTEPKTKARQMLVLAS
jgi:hypothetical protein